MSLPYILNIKVYTIKVIKINKNKTLRNLFFLIAATIKKQLLFHEQYVKVIDELSILSMVP